jgi:molecular chaperone HtpG
LDLFWGDQHKGVQLYIRRVFIMDNSEALLPPYLRFIKGVIDSPDLPLNVSREVIQQSAPLEKIKSNLVHTILNTLAGWKKKEADQYLSFFRELGLFLKEGVVQDYANREKLADLLFLESTKTEPGKFTTLAEYLERLPADQSDIWYIIGENRLLLEQSPHLETFKEKGQEVLLLTDPIDEFVTQALPEFKGKKLKAVDRGDLGGTPVSEETNKRFQPLLGLMKDLLKEEVKEVRLSHRLKDSASCLVTEEGALGPHMEQLLKRMGRGQEVSQAKRILELNPGHPAVEALVQWHTRDAKDERLSRYSRLLYDQALIAEGSRVKDPLAFTRIINELLVKEAAG